MTFFEKTEQFLNHVAEKDQKYYTPVFHALRHGTIYPMFQRMEVECQHKIFGLQIGKGRIGRGSEYCYFDICETLDKQKLSEYLDLVVQLEEKDVDCNNREHDFSFVSVVVLTQDFSDPALRKMLKRFSKETKYLKSEGQHGWSSCRVCVVDLGTDKVYWNSTGDALANRVGGEMFQQPSMLETLKNLVSF